MGRCMALGRLDVSFSMCSYDEEQTTVQGTDFFGGCMYI